MKFNGELSIATDAELRGLIPAVKVAISNEAKILNLSIAWLAFFGLPE
jgi:hypothetical protein